MGAETVTEKSDERLGLIASVTGYIRDVRIEMSKVSWPTRNELRDSTLVVIVMVFIISIFIGVVDRGLSYTFEALVKLAG